MISLGGEKQNNNANLRITMRMTRILMRPQVFKKDFLYTELSYHLNGIFFAVHNELGRFRNEKQYCDGIEAKLQEAQIPYKREYPLPASFKGEHSRRNIVDFFIEDKIVLEIKAKPGVDKQDYYQVLRYLSSLQCRIGILVNFGRYTLVPKRILNSHHSHS